jgi:D-alanyl-D-alanine carboxypeptidase
MILDYNLGRMRSFDLRPMTPGRARGTVASMLTLRSPLAALAALLLLPAAAGARQPQAALDRVVAAGAPGAVALAGGRTCTAGVADLPSHRPLRPGDRIRIGSVTKSFTAVVALQLVQEGRLSLDDTVGQHLPGVLAYGDRITVRQLLTHTSGVPDDITPALLELFHGDPFRLWTPTETVGLVREQPPRFPAGSAWAYSNTDYVLLGLTIERVTGTTLEHELERRILRPLRLRDTSFPVRSSELGRHSSRGYSLELGPDGPIEGTLRDMTAYSPSFAWAAGNGVSTVREVARFYRALLRGRLLSPHMLREALTGVETGRPGRRSGLGVELRDTPHGTLIGHEGDIPGFSIKALSSRDARHQAVVAVNMKFGPEAVEDVFDAAGEAAVRAAFRR